LGETGDGAGLDHGAAVYGAAVEALRHFFLPERVFSGGDFAAAAPARQEAMTSFATHKRAAPNDLGSAE
jgi:hypothetical protein